MSPALITLLLSCNRGPKVEQAAPLPPAQAGAPVAFAHIPAARLDLPDGSRPEMAAAPDELVVFGPFEQIRTVDGVATYEAPLPFRSRSLFFSKAPRSMSLYQGGKKLRFDRKKEAKGGTWAFTAKTVQVRVAKGEPKPQAGDLHFTYARATTREDSLNLIHSGIQGEEMLQHHHMEAFVKRSLQLDENTRSGLFLPAPAVASFDQIAFPANATLQLEATVLPAETITDLRSDGAVLVVKVGDEEVLRQPLKEGDWRPIGVDLARFAGQTHTVSFHTEGGDSNLLDYVFLADPVLYTPTTQPKRVVLVFLDTLRYDHLGVYGYERETSPRLDAWAQDAVVFDQARSVAPWTLPSTRSILSGYHPELWGNVATLPQILAGEGWATGAFVGNVYLSSNFDMADGWSQHSVVNWPTIDDQIRRTKGFVERHPGRDVLVMLHTMDMHLPYTEPSKYRDLYAGPAPDGLKDNSTRTPILKAAKKDEAEVRDWLIGRYDNNIRYTDDELMDFLEWMGPDTTVVVFSDHGEEFWDHDDFEHGHTLYDELLRVPLIVKHPGVAPARVAEPVSNIDITPTVLELVGLPMDQSQGISLVGAMDGDAQALQQLAEHPRSVGRPLYGQERWGVVSGGIKWTSHDGKEQVFDLSADPGEATNLRATTPLAPYHQAFGAGLETRAPVLWRLEPGKATGGTNKDLVVRISHPEGIEDVWLGGDPLKSSDMCVAGPDEDGVFTLWFYKGKSGTREVYILPKGDVTQTVGLTLEINGTAHVAPEIEQPAPDGTAQQLYRVTDGGRLFRLWYGVAAVPLASWSQLDAMNDEDAAALEALGYMERDADAAEETATRVQRSCE